VRERGAALSAATPGGEVRQVRTQVGIVGAGPAGLLLSHLLHLHGVESVVLEVRSREYVEQRVRAGVLEHGTVDLLTWAGVADRLHREGMIHHGIELRFERQGHRIPLTDLTGRSITVYGQQEVVKDLIRARLDAGGQMLFEVADVSVADLTTDAPAIRFRREGEQIELRCDVIAGCDGSHGICRPSIPDGALGVYERAYPFAWLGVLARAAPSSEELIYTYHERGFALHSMRTPEITRLYLQTAPDADLADWPDERIWAELQARMSTGDGGFALNEGEILDKGITAMRSVVVEPMRYGRLFLAGDAAHIVPPTGAKGLNLAVADVRVLAEAIADWYRSGSAARLDAYSDVCLRRVWRIQHFSWWMTSMLHRFAEDDPFQHQLQLSQLRYVTSSTAAATSLAENYVGLPMP
jgi:p-hydroxybenzoate 3-monooxygenase